MPLRLGGAAFMLCPVALLVVAAPIGESRQLLAAAAALVLFVLGLTGLRQLATGLGLPTLLIAVAVVAVMAVVIGTLLELSGVVIGILVGAAIAVVLRFSRWRAGDLSLFGLALGFGSGVAYVLDNIFYDDNGSSTDQAVPVLVIPSIVLAVLALALARTRPISTAARVCVALGVVLGLAAFIIAMATRDQAFVAVALPAGLLFILGLEATGFELIRMQTATRDREA